MTNAVWNLYAIRYGQNTRRTDAETFLGGDPAKPIRGLDFFMWVAVGPDRAIVIDTGLKPEKLTAMGREVVIDPIEGLRRAGVDSEAVDEVILTHAHFDHVGNLGAFPNARFWMQDLEMQSITGRDMTHPLFRVAYHAEDTKELVQLVYDDRMRFIEGDGTYAPGIDYFLIGGHSRGQMALRIETPRGPVLLASDAVHLYEEVTDERPFLIFYDMQEMLDGYRRCVDLAGSPDRLVPGHDPIVSDQYPAPSPDLEGIVLDLGQPPKA